MTPEEELHAAVRQAINDSETAASNPDHLLDLQAEAAVGAMLRLGWVKVAGWEFAAKRGDVTLFCGFHTAEGALRHAEGKYGDLAFSIVRRPVGVWERLQ